MNDQNVPHFIVPRSSFPYMLNPSRSSPSMFSGR